MARRGRMPDHSHLSQLLQVEAPAQHRAVGALGWVQIQGVQLCPPERIAPLPGAQGELKGPVLHPSVTSLHTHFAGKPGPCRCLRRRDTRCCGTRRPREAAKPLGRHKFAQRCCSFSVPSAEPSSHLLSPGARVNVSSPAGTPVAWSPTAPAQSPALPAGQRRATARQGRS
ncbi:uncharacterized protein LOC141916027 isoform X3 [Strix aluco]|uniref:uncharacterized protein LOC141916027 isoform X3 n=1 Tax=Strix aluco TaxID=111821 RepID=UPI003DA61A9D